MSSGLKRIADIEEKPHPKFPNVFIKQIAVNNETDRLSANYVRILPGAELIPHTHGVLEIFHVIKGNGSALVNNERIEVFGGEVIIALPNTEHGLKNIGNSDIELYAVFSPGIV